MSDSRDEYLEDRQSRADAAIENRSVVAGELTPKDEK